MIGDNNDLALALAMTIPLAWFCKDLFPQKYIKPAWIAIAVTGVAAVIMTNSRGGFLAMAVGILCVLFYSKRKVATLVVVVAAAGTSIFLVRATFVERMSTLQAPYERGVRILAHRAREDRTENGQGSPAAGRGIR